MRGELVFGVRSSRIVGIKRDVNANENEQEWVTMVVVPFSLFPFPSAFKERHLFPHAMRTYCTLSGSSTSRQTRHRACVIATTVMLANDSLRDLRTGHRKRGVYRSIRKQRNCSEGRQLGCDARRAPRRCYKITSCARVVCFASSFRCYPHISPRLAARLYVPVFVLRSLGVIFFLFL